MQARQALAEYLERLPGTHGCIFVPLQRHQASCLLVTPPCDLEVGHPVEPAGQGDRRLETLRCALEVARRHQDEPEVAVGSGLVPGVRGESVNEADGLLGVPNCRAVPPQGALAESEDVVGVRGTCRSLHRGLVDEPNRLLEQLDRALGRPARAMEIGKPHARVDHLARALAMHTSAHVERLLEVFLSLAELPLLPQEVAELCVCVRDGDRLPAGVQVGDPEGLPKVAHSSRMLETDGFHGGQIRKHHDPLGIVGSQAVA